MKNILFLLFFLSCGSKELIEGKYLVVNSESKLFGETFIMLDNKACISQGKLCYNYELIDVKRGTDDISSLPFSLSLVIDSAELRLDTLELHRFKKTYFNDLFFYDYDKNFEFFIDYYSNQYCILLGNSEFLIKSKYNNNVIKSDFIYLDGRNNQNGCFFRLRSDSIKDQNQEVRQVYLEFFDVDSSEVLISTQNKRLPTISASRNLLNGDWHIINADNNLRDVPYRLCFYKTEYGEDEMLIFTQDNFNYIGKFTFLEDYDLITWNKNFFNTNYFHIKDISDSILIVNNGKKDLKYLRESYTSRFAL
jgi:hypothetical protein